MTAEHALSCLCDELKHSVDELESFDDAEKFVSYLNCTEDEVARSRIPSMPIYIFACAAHLTYNLHNL
jgi:hypothetical protein